MALDTEKQYTYIEMNKHVQIFEHNIKLQQSKT